MIDTVEHSEFQRVLAEARLSRLEPEALRSLVQDELAAIQQEEVRP